jgi:2-phospho-L-lactate guanylyltransferase (CobY/MobA/RfbA family)
MMTEGAVSKPWAILPVKSVKSAKQRLSDALSGRERQQLFHEMLTDVLAAIEHSKQLATRRSSNSAIKLALEYSRLTSIAANLPR